MPLWSTCIEEGLAERAAAPAAGGKAKGGSTGEKKAPASKQKRGKKAAPVEPDQADELAAAGVAVEDPALETENSESAAGTGSEGDEAEEGTSGRKPVKQAILKAPSAKQKPGKVAFMPTWPTVQPLAGSLASALRVQVPRRDPCTQTP